MRDYMHRAGSKTVFLKCYNRPVKREKKRDTAKEA